MTKKVRRATLQDLDQLVPLFNAYRQFYEMPADLPLAAAGFDGGATSVLERSHLPALADADATLALDPAGRGRLVWHAGAQDVLAIGRLVATGQVDVTRTIGLGGPAVASPRLWRVPLDQEVNEELALHIELRTRELIERGLDPRTAREIVSRNQETQPRQEEG